ncbi:MAG: hypothetical protein ACLP7P_01400 [Rhodomicrobium sp.]
MKAAVSRTYGPPEGVKIEEVEKPDPPKYEVSIKVRTTTVTAGDWRVRSLTTPKGWGLIARLMLSDHRD